MCCITCRWGSELLLMISLHLVQHGVISTFTFRVTNIKRQEIWRFTHAFFFVVKFITDLCKCVSAWGKCCTASDVGFIKAFSLLNNKEPALIVRTDDRKSWNCLRLWVYLLLHTETHDFSSAEPLILSNIYSDGGCMTPAEALQYLT